MSFGFGVGDFLAVVTLANEIRKKFVDAPAQFKAISDDQTPITRCTRCGNRLVWQGAKQPTRRRATGIARNCRNVLTDAETMIHNYGIVVLAPNNKKQNLLKRAWKRLTWEPNDIQELRLRITSNVVLLNAFNGKITQNTVTRLAQHQDDQERQVVLDWLSPMNYATLQEDYINRREQGTGQWLLESPEFQWWITGVNSNRTLFCPGIPGGRENDFDLYGRYGNDSDVAIAYVYCNFQRHNEQDAASLLGNILKQMVQRKHTVPSSVRALYNTHMHTGTRPSINEISEAMHSLSTASDFSSIFIVIDALDECQISDRSRDILLDVVISMQAKRGCNVYLFATSRFIPEIIEMFNEQPTVEIRARENDVKRYIQGNLTMLPSFVSRSPDLQEEISDAIAKAVDGMFLLAQLYLNSLVGKRSAKAIRSALEGLSCSTRQYGFAFHDAMERIKGQVPDQIELAMQVLAWITCATRQLTTTELQVALTVEVGESDLDKENLPDLDDMVSVCAGLVTVDKQSNIIRLVHYTAQEYFERNQSTWFPKAHDDIGNICVTFLSFDVFKTAHRARNASPSISSWPIRCCLLGIPLSSFLGFSPGLTRLLVTDSTPKKSLRRVDSSFYQAEQPFLTTGLHIAAYFGLPNIAQRFISLGTLVDSKDAVQETPLCWAAQHGRDNLVRLLIENGANPNHKDGLGYTPLHFAALNDYDEIAGFILDNGGDPMCGDAQVYLPFHIAVMTGSEKVARLLLQRGVHPHARDFEDHTPLWLASIFGHESTAFLLLDWDVQPQSVDLDACLSTAAEYGVRISTLQTIWDARQLMLALLAVNESVIRLLLDLDIDLEVKNRQGRTALSLAAELGNWDAVRQVLEKGANPNSYDIDGRTAVFLAACQQDATVLTLLLPSGISTFERDRYGRTPLHAAANRGHSECVRALLDAGIDCEVKDNFGRTALSDALTRGRNDVANIIRAFSIKNPITMDELACRTAQLTGAPRGVSCDICCAHILIGESFYYCRLCNGGNFDICELCHHGGARCLHSTHNLEQLQERRFLQIRPRIQLLQLMSPKCRPNSRSWIEEASIFRESLNG
ncbi:hypothetical protein N7505_003804 [Penicillium chrysogenum]|uniref:Ankyrin repeat protein n=1 Tax=Penicillium chrysogenum TaxID=5076 RepID=A0ABQ8WRG9_PENCH|nr:hypothetical protein N7505_003804 [Penicillium chrysogenum]